MDWGAVAIAGATVIAAGLTVLADRGARRGQRQQLKHDLELMAGLPDGPARAALQQHVEQGVLRLVADEDERHRDLSGSVIALLFLTIAAAAGYLAFRNDGSEWWLVLMIPTGFFGVFGLSESATRQRRDERGRRIPDESQGTQDSEDPMPTTRTTRSRVARSP